MVDNRHLAIWVFKLSGSLQANPRLTDWLGMLAGKGNGRVTIVPGGGSFADAVRAAQRALEFDDRSAHRMALLAMAQYGYALCALESRLLPARSLEEVRATLAAQHVPVWLPLDLLDTHAGIEESWRMTSDSLAAWIAGKLGAAQLVLVKAASIPTAAGPETLAQAGIVDPLLPDYAHAARCELHVVNEADIERVRALLEEQN